MSIYTELLWILWNYQRTSRWLSYFDKEESDSISLESATFLSVLGLGLKLMDADPFLVFLQQRNNTLKYCTYTTHKSTVHIPHTEVLYIYHTLFVCVHHQYWITNNIQRTKSQKEFTCIAKAVWSNYVNIKLQCHNLHDFKGLMIMWGSYAIQKLIFFQPSLNVEGIFQKIDLKYFSVDKMKIRLFLLQIFSFLFSVFWHILLVKTPLIWKKNTKQLNKHSLPLIFFFNTFV